MQNDGKDLTTGSEDLNLRNKKDNKWKTIAISSLVLLVFVLICFIALIYFNISLRNELSEAKNQNALLKSDNAKGNETNNSSGSETTKNQGYLVIQEWNVRMKIPEGLTDVRYFINDDNTEASIIAKPVGYDVQYVSNINEAEFLKAEALGFLTRSNEAKIDVNGRDVEGKKIGNYFYYTAWSFSGLATGVGIMGRLYGWDGIDPDLYLTDAAGEAWQLVNQKLLPSIEEIN